MENEVYERICRVADPFFICQDSGEVKLPHP